MHDEVDKCVNCGFCESVCPTLSPSGFNAIMGARGRVDLGKAFVNDLRKTGRSELRISDSFYSCVDCFACVQVCPAGVNAGKVSEIGRKLVTSGVSEKNGEKKFARMIVEATMKYDNPLGVREKCADWAGGLEFDRESDTLLYTGNMYQLMAYNAPMERLQKRLGKSLSSIMAGIVARYPAPIKISGLIADREMEKQVSAFLRSMYDLLRLAGVKFNYLGSEEPYPGTFIHDLGYRDEFMEYGKHVIDLFRRHGVKTIITVDPHTYDLLNVQYRKFFSEFDFKVVHYLDFLRELEYGKSPETVTLHEPCHFTLRDDSYSAPAVLVGRIAKINFPERSGKRLMCCGGPDELLFSDLATRISDERFSQLKATGAEKIVTACPICYANLRKDESVIDISQFLTQNLKGKLSL